MGILEGVVNSAASYGGSKLLQEDRQDFAYNMDSTKYQRSVNDMVAAGLNPALAASGNSGVQASAGGTDGGGAGVSSALSAKLAKRKQDLDYTVATGKPTSASKAVEQKGYNKTYKRR